MVVSSNLNKAGPYEGNGVATEFAFNNIKVFDDDDIVVLLRDDEGAETLLVKDSNYSVALNADQDADPGGSITYPLSGSPLAADHFLTILREISAVQETDITNLGGFFPQIIENMADRNTMLAQQNTELVRRAIRFTRSASAVQLGSLEIPVSTVDKFLKIGPTGLLTLEGIAEGSLTESTILSAANPLQPEETAVGAVPIDYHYKAGHVNRYLTNTTPGTTVMSTAIAAAFAVAKEGIGFVEFNANEIYLTDDLMSITDVVGVQVFGNGATIKARLTDNENVWTFLEPEHLIIWNLLFDGGFGVTTFSNHIISMRSPVHSHVRYCHFSDWEEAAVIMFGNGTDLIEDCTIDTCTADGLGAGNIAFMIGDCVRSYIINPKAVNVLGTNPGYTFQLKNLCEDSHILDFLAENCHIAVSMSAPDEPNTVGSGAANCTARGVAKNCVAPAFLEKTSYCEFDIVADMALNASASAAIVCNARNIGTRISVLPKNVHSSVPVIKHSSSDRITYYVRNWDTTGAYLWDIGDGGAQPGAEWNRLILEGVSLNSASFEPLNSIRDLSGETTNQFVDLRNLSHNALSGTTILPFPLSGANRLQNSIRFSASLVSVIHGGVTKNLIEPATATTAQLADIANAINTTNKYTHKKVINTTTGIEVYAADATAGGVWKNVGTGATAHTPV